MNEPTGAHPLQDSPYQYWAFISYSSKDRAWAKWLHSVLEHYRLPIQLVQHPTPIGEPAPQRLKPLFWDRAELQAHYDLGELIERSLRGSRYLIVICSPNAAQSPWVEKEILAFQRMHGPERILALIVDGEPNAKDAANCFPPTLRAREPKAPDARKQGDGKSNAKLMLLATMLGVPFDSLKCRDQERKMRLMAVSLVAAVLVLSCMGWLAWRESVARKAASAATELAEQKRKEADLQRIQVSKERDIQNEHLWSASRADHEAALVAFNEGRHSEALAYFERALEYRPMNAAALASSAVHCFWHMGPAWRTRWVCALESVADCVAFSTDSAYLAVGRSNKDQKSGAVHVIDPATGNEINVVKFDGPIRTVAFGSDGRYLAAAGWEESVWVIEPATGNQISKTALPGALISCVAFSPDGRYLAVGSGIDDMDRVIDAVTTRANTGAVRVIEATTGKVIYRASFRHSVDSVSFSPDSRCLAASDSSSMKVFAIATQTEINNVKLVGSVASVNFSPDGRFVAAESKGKTVQVIEVATGVTISNADFVSKTASAGRWSPDGRYYADEIATGLISHLKIKPRPDLSPEGFNDSVKFSSDGRYLAAACNDKTLRLFEAVSGRETGRIEIVTLRDPGRLRFSPDGRHLAVLNGSNAAHIIDLERSKEISKVISEAPVTSLSFSPDGRHIAAGSADSIARIVETATGAENKTIRYDSAVSDVCFSPNSRYVAVGCGGTLGELDNSTRVIESETCKEIWNKKLIVPVISLDFSPDGLRLAVGSWDAARVLEAATGKEISKVKFANRVADRVAVVAFSPNGRYFAVGSWDKTARVIEAATGKEISRVVFDADVNCVLFSSDGRYLAAGGGDNTARVIEAETGKVISTVKCKAKVISLSFSPGGQCLAVASFDADALALVIETATGKEIARIKSEGDTRVVGFSRDGRYLATGEVRLISGEWFVPEEEITGPWRSALRVQSGLKLTSDGKLAPLSVDELLAAQREVAAFVSIKPKSNERWQHAILQWSRMPPELRTTSPWTTEPTSVAVGRWFMEAPTYGNTITDLADQAPWHPLEPVSLARLAPIAADKVEVATQEAMMIRQRFLASLTLERFRNADEKIYGRDTLAEYAAWAAKIMHEELHLDAEAREALHFALDRTPPEKQRGLLDLQTTLRP